MNIPTSIAIRTSFAHHASHAGYKQILRFTKPAVVLGVDEHKPNELSALKRRYHFLVEWDAKRYARQHSVDLLHILYGEEYFRFATKLMPHIPIIATFHQPPKVLKREIEIGDAHGKVARIAHLLNPKRFSQLSAAIVMTQAQKEVLTNAMPAEKVHVIPLGADLKLLTQKYQEIEAQRDLNRMLTVGNWMRDWDFYIHFVGYCMERRPSWKFVLVNRKLAKEYRDRLSAFPNVQILSDISDDELYGLYKSSALQFLPFIGAAGNNSMNEGLAMGCPVATNILNTAYRNADTIVSQFDSGSLEAALTACEQLQHQLQTQADQMVSAAQNAVMDYDWSSIGQQTLNIYNSVL